VIGKINIVGHIGASYVDEQGVAHMGTDLLSVVDQAASYPDAKEFEVSINSPGGFVDVGNQIFDYLNTLKKKAKVTTKQTGLVGSIATKIFLAGDERLADDRYQFWIHNPFQEGVSGDADELQKAATEVAQTETELRGFYASFTSLTDEVLDSLMKIETGMTADQCVKFGFATGKVSTPVFNVIKNMNEKTILEKIEALFSKASKKGVQPTKAEIPGAAPKSMVVNLADIEALFSKASKKGVQPTKAEIPGAAPKSMVVNLADGAGKFWVEGEAVVDGASAFLLDEAGQPTMEPLADGTYALEDGSNVTVTGGKIAVQKAEGDPLKEEEEEVLTADKVKQMIAEALSAQATTHSAEIASVKEEAKNEIMALKKSVKLGVQPQKAVMTSAKIEYKSIAQKMAEKAEERKKQLNKN
jgi:ATP-dependent protease ClpP protease subunit